MGNSRKPELTWGVKVSLSAYEVRVGEPIVATPCIEGANPEVERLIVLHRNIVNDRNLNVGRTVGGTRRSMSLEAPLPTPAGPIRLMRPAATISTSTPLILRAIRKR